MPATLMLPNGSTMPLPDNAAVGRAASCQVVLPAEDAEASRLHAQVYRAGQDYWLRDLGSRNGTYVNGQRVHGPVRLTDGSSIQLGRTVLEFRVSGARAWSSPVRSWAARRRARAQAGGLRVSDFRHPAELLVFGFNAFLLLSAWGVALGILFIVSIVTTFGISFIFEVAGMGLWALGLFIALGVHYYRIQSSHPPVLAATHPEVFGAAQEAARRLNMVAPAMHVRAHEEDLNAFAAHFGKPLVVLTQGLVDELSSRQLQFVLGHEFGHVRAWHTPLKMLLHNEMMHSHIGAVLWLPCVLMRLIMLIWDRLSEHTADRAGLIACRDLATAVWTLAAVHYGTDVAARLDLQAFACEMQAEDRWTNALSAVGAEHPTLQQRVSHLVQFAASPQFGAIEAHLGEHT